MEKLSKEYGWTPDQIRHMTINDVADYVEIISLRNQIEKANAKKYGNRK